MPISILARLRQCFRGRATPHTPRRQAARPRSPYAPCLESLENRTLLSSGLPAVLVPPPAPAANTAVVTHESPDDDAEYLATDPDASQPPNPSPSSEDAAAEADEYPVPPATGPVLQGAVGPARPVVPVVLPLNPALAEDGPAPTSPRSRPVDPTPMVVPPPNLVNGTAISSKSPASAADLQPRSAAEAEFQAHTQARDRILDLTMLASTDGLGVSITLGAIEDRGAVLPAARTGEGQGQTTVLPPHSSHAESVRATERLDSAVAVELAAWPAGQPLDGTRSHPADRCEPRTEMRTVERRIGAEPVATLAAADAPTPGVTRTAGGVRLHRWLELLVVGLFSGSLPLLWLYRVRGREPRLGGWRTAGRAPHV